MKSLLFLSLIFFSTYSLANQRRDATPGMAMIACKVTSHLGEDLSFLVKKLNAVLADEVYRNFFLTQTCGTGCEETVYFRPPYEVSSPTFFGGTEKEPSRACVTVTKK